MRNHVAVIENTLLQHLASEASGRADEKVTRRLCKAEAPSQRLAHAALSLESAQRIHGVAVRW